MSSGGRAGGHALVLGDGEAPTRADLDAAWPGWDADVGLVVAADGGARLGPALGLRIDAWVGDGDSLPVAAIEALRADGVAVDLVPPAKDESDLELALARAARPGIDRITVVGALRGPRLDHELANVFLLAHPMLAAQGIDAALVDPRARVTLLDASHSPRQRRFVGRTGDLVSLFPLDGTVAGVTTSGLGYPLRDEPLAVGPARGLSNARTADEATVALRSGRLLVVETPARLGS